MSQVATKRKIQLRSDRVIVRARFLEQGSVLRGTKRGSAESFQIGVELESDAEQAEIVSLLQLAHRMCFTEAALTNSVRVEFAHRLNGDSLSLPREPE